MPEAARPIRTVGRYELLGEIGRGGMAVVYAARQVELDRVVALKELAALHASDAAVAHRFLRESRLAGSLTHPHIVTVHDYLEHEGIPYISMELMEGGSLRPHVGRLSLAQTIGLLEGVLAGLSHAESHQIVHRDLKPENLLLTADGTVKIADFGIAKAINRIATAEFRTATGATFGTPTYMAPEQAMGKGLTAATDLYSVGVMAYEVFVGRVPFEQGDTPVSVLLAHVNEPVPPPRELNPALDARLADWIESLLAKQPSDRTATAKRAWEELEDIAIRLLGPRWRRDAALDLRDDGGDRSKRSSRSMAPASPPVEALGSGAGSARSEYLTFGRRPSGDRGPAAPARALDAPVARDAAQARAEVTSRPDESAPPEPAEPQVSVRSVSRLATVPPRRPATAPETRRLVEGGRSRLRRGGGSPARSGRRRRPLWLALVLPAAIGAAFGLLVLRSDDSPREGPRAPIRYVGYRAPFFAVDRPSGWEIRCRERADSCAGDPVRDPSDETTAPIERTTFAAPGGEAGLAIDRYLGVRRLDEVVPGVRDTLSDKPVRRIVDRERGRLGGHRYAKFAFRAAEPAATSGSNYVLELPTTVYVITAQTALADAREARRVDGVARRVAESLRTRSGA